MKTVGVSIVIAALMTVAAAVGVAARPSSKPSGAGPRYVLETIVPKEFGGWREIAQEGAQVVNPQTQELLNKLYSQILTRTYVNASGYRVMLSLAYGDDQRADLTAHKPEVCYPAQGFQLHSNAEDELATPFGMLWQAVHDNVNASTQGGIVFEMNRVATALGFPEFIAED